MPLELDELLLELLELDELDELLELEELDELLELEELDELDELDELLELEELLVPPQPVSTALKTPIPIRYARVENPFGVRIFML